VDAQEPLGIVGDLLGEPPDRVTDIPLLSGCFADRDPPLENMLAAVPEAAFVERL